MKALRVAALLAALAPAAALACGGFYAQGVEVSPDQKIIVTHRAGIETYVFRPHFCGTAKDFGVILPIPATLSSNPALADNALFDQLDLYTSPTVVEVCRPSGGIGCGMAAKNVGGDFQGSDSGVNVVDRGRVGIFDFVLLQATTANAFTDWLDQNGYPRGANGSDAYASYVARGWYFVAFKVSADTQAPAAGMKLCGDLGPIQLSFATPQPVIPARIAAVNGTSGTWRIFTIASSQQKLDAASAAALSSDLYFANSFVKSALGGYATLDAAVRDGERLTVLNVSFSGSAPVDIGLVEDSARDFRSTVEVSKVCPGACSLGPGGGLEALAALGLLSAWRALRRRR